MRHDRQYADDIVRACDRILDYLAGRSADDFGNTALVQDAVIRQILVIGEATKRLSQEFRDSTADVPWTKIAGMRDVLVHGYDGIDFGEVRRTATIDLPRTRGEVASV